MGLTHFFGTVSCASNGLTFFAENENYRGEREEGNSPARKLQAELFIDDRNLGGLPDWGVIYEAVRATSKKTHNPLHVMAGMHHDAPVKKKKWWQR